MVNKSRGRKILLVLAGQFLVQRLELELAEQCSPLGIFQSGIAIGNQRALRGIGGSGCGERQGGEQDADQGLGGFGGHASLLEMECVIQNCQNKLTNIFDYFQKTPFNKSSSLHSKC